MSYIPAIDRPHYTVSRRPTTDMAPGVYRVVAGGCYYGTYVVVAHTWWSPNPCVMEWSE